MQGALGMIFAAEGLRAVAAVPSSSKTMPQDLTYAEVLPVTVFCVAHANFCENLESMQKL